MRRLLLILMLGLSLKAGQPLVPSMPLARGRVTDGHGGLPGVRVYPDRPRQPWPAPPVPMAITDAEGRYTLPIARGDEVLVFDKSGWERDLVPLTETAKPVALRRAARHRTERVLVVRLDFPGDLQALDDDDLRGRLFYRQPGVSSASSYFHEVSKGHLELEEGAILRMTAPLHATPHRDEDLGEVAAWVLSQLKGIDLKDFDAVNNETGAGGPDGKPDHLWIILPGAPRTLTHEAPDFTPTSFLLPLPWNPARSWPLVLFPEETPLGNIVHEALHAMGEQRVDDLSVEDGDPETAGIWDVMDMGMYRGWEPGDGPWFQHTGSSPSQPMGWIRGELWYGGIFRDTVPALRMPGTTWTGWMDPLARAPGGCPQRLLVPDPRGAGRFWEFNVRRAWGFDRGRIGGRRGPGSEGLIVARVDPSRLSDGEPAGPVHVVDAHPGSQEPPPPRFADGRWQLDDAAFNLGKGENPKGSDGPLEWEVLDADPAGRMRVRIALRARNTLPGRP